MSYSEEGNRDTLKFRLLGTSESAGFWGHEFVRYLAAEIGEEYAYRQSIDKSTDDICELALDIVPFFLSHNAEADAVDLLSEIEKIEKIIPMIDINNYSRVCLYMVRYYEIY